jgi:hypothetical protein
MKVCTRDKYAEIEVEMRLTECQLKRIRALVNRFLKERRKSRAGGTK